jgi:hypothetical protein
VMERAADQSADCSRRTPQQPEMNVARQLSDDKLELRHVQMRKSGVDDGWEGQPYAEEPVGMKEMSRAVTDMP